MTLSEVCLRVFTLFISSSVACACVNFNGLVLHVMSILGIMLGQLKQLYVYHLSYIVNSINSLTITCFMSHVIIIQLVREAKAEAEFRRDDQVSFNKNVGCNL